MTARDHDQEFIDDMDRAVEEGRELQGWTRVGARVSKNPRAVYTLRLSPEEYQEFSEAARAQNMNLSDFLRSAARAAIDGSLDLEAAAIVRDFKDLAGRMTRLAGHLPASSKSRRAAASSSRAGSSRGR